MEEIVNALKIITNNFETGFHESTLMGWEKNYDLQGRLINCDPNYKTGSVRIENKKYWFVRHGWEVKVWDEPVHYLNTTLDCLITIDLKPDYIK